MEELTAEHKRQIYKNKDDIIVLKINQDQLMKDVDEINERDERYDRKIEELIKIQTDTITSQATTTTQLKVILGIITATVVPVTLVIVNYMLDRYLGK